MDDMNEENENSVVSGNELHNLEEITDENEVQAEPDDNEEVVANEEIVEDESTIEPNGIPIKTEEAEEVEEVKTFCVRSSQGISINGVNFCRGTYYVGQMVGTMIITEDIRNNILSTDAKSIASNPHLAA